MTFDVVIPLYNKEYSIENCLLSVINQSYKKFNLIIVNDGSLDNGAKVAEEFLVSLCFENFKIINQKNSGVSGARNTGILHADQSHICFLDADDEWKPDFLENMEKLILEFPEAGLYCLQHETAYINKQRKKNKSQYFENYFGLVDSLCKRSLLGSVANSSKVCIKKVAIQAISCFPDGQKAGEDLYVWIELARNYPVAFYNKVSVVINITPDNSRVGRELSVPYPFLHYSLKENVRKLGFWEKIYLFKVYLSHVFTSLKNKDYYGYCERVRGGRTIFPLTSFLLSSLKIFLKAINKHV